MNDPLTVKAIERGTVRVFALDMTAREVDRLRNPGPPPGFAFSDDPAKDFPDYVASDDERDPIATLLGTDLADSDFVEVFHTDDISAIGLATYLVEGNGAAEAQIEADRARLDALHGHVVIVLSAAFGGQATTLRPDPRLTLVGCYTEPPPAPVLPLPQYDSAKGIIAGPPVKVVSDAAMGGRVAAVVLLLLFLFVMAFVWMAA